MYDPPAAESPDLAGDGTVRWRSLLAEAERRLTGRGVVAPAVDARRMVEEASGHRGAALFLALDEPATVARVAHFDALLARREAGEPLQYVLGHWAFRSLDLLVDRRVLIPRPETEHVCGLALAELDRVTAGSEPPMVVDLGSGSGALAIAIATERPGSDVWAVERSPDAAAVCRTNVAAAGQAAARVRVLEGSWFEPLPAELRGRVDVIVSNPPYVAASEVLPAEVGEWEPVEALVAGPTGLEDVGHLVAEAPAWLRPGGALVVEIGETQGTAAAALAFAAGFAHVAVERDLAGRDRVLLCRL